MEEFGCFWSYQESLDEARQQLLYTTLELETLKMEANEQMRKHKTEIKQLIELINTANKQRDEARGQLQKILYKLIPCSSTSSPQSPVVIPITANSSITESSSLSNHNSLNSSPVDSFFDAVTSPDFSNISDSNRINNFINKTIYDPADAAIDSIAKGKILPEKGKLLEAVTEAGPILQTLLVAGPLPQWRNPPPLKSFKIPPVSIDQKPAVGPKLGYVDMGRGGSSQMCSASILSFGAASAAKRQRLH